MISLGNQPFVTSSYTNNNGACVEVGSDQPDAVLMSDSKFNHSESGRTVKPVLSMSAAAFTALVTHVRA